MIYFCIPSHNEAATVGLVLWKLRRVLEESAREYQLLVGDDASTDATAEALEPYLKALPLTVLRNPTRLGTAATVERLLTGTSATPRSSSLRTSRWTRTRSLNSSSGSIAGLIWWSARRRLWASLTPGVSE